MNTPPVYIVTATGHRPYSFTLCIKWVERWAAQYRDWYVVSDSEDTWDALKNVRHTKVVASPPLKKEPNSFRTNMLALLNAVPRDGIVVLIEDDDYYPTDYVSNILANLSKREYLPDLFGFPVIPVYHTGLRLYRISKGHERAILTCYLSQTVLGTAKAIDYAINTLLEMRPGEIDLDVRLWSAESLLKVLPVPLPVIDIKELASGSVSIKGLPGRRGLGIGHNLRSSYNKKRADIHWVKELLGNDYAYYYGLDSKTYKENIALLTGSNV